MSNQKTVRKFASFAAPSRDDLANFESLPPDQQRKLLEAEIQKGMASGLSERTFDEVVEAAKAKLAIRRNRNG